MRAESNSALIVSKASFRRAWLCGWLCPCAGGPVGWRLRCWLRISLGRVSEKNGEIRCRWCSRTWACPGWGGAGADGPRHSLISPRPTSVPTLLPPGSPFWAAASQARWIAAGSARPARHSLSSDRIARSPRGQTTSRSIPTYSHINSLFIRRGAPSSTSRPATRTRQCSPPAFRCWPARCERLSAQKPATAHLYPSVGSSGTLYRPWGLIEHGVTKCSCRWSTYSSTFRSIDPDTTI